jgi:serine/threonine protein kinase
MAAGEQEHPTPLDSAIPTTEQPTSAFGVKQMETIPSALHPASQGSSGTLDPFPAGRILGQYRILARLGGGGMGHVYKAVHPVMERVVALKVIVPRLMQDDSARARFQREVRNAARLIHPNIVVAHDAAEVEGLWFLVMEYIEGRDASQLLAQQGRPSVQLACEIVRQAALGLQYAHECGMVHRDIKPANLIVANARPMPAGSGDGWPEAPLVKILDFGLARLIAPEGAGATLSDGVTQEGYVVGTPEYMAPEQARDSGRVDIRSDIYSLGCTLYALLAGRPPFKALSTFDLAVMHLNQPPEPIVRYCPTLPVELSAVVHRLLAKRPEDRLATPGEVVRALQPWTRSTDAPQSIALGGDAAPRITPSARPTFVKPDVPPEILQMHFQALLRTFLVVFLIVVVGVGCFLYLPDIGNQIHYLWQRMTPASGKTTPAGRSGGATPG